MDEAKIKIENMATYKTNNAPHGNYLDQWFKTNLAQITKVKLIRLNFETITQNWT